MERKGLDPGGQARKGSRGRRITKISRVEERPKAITDSRKNPSYQLRIQRHRGCTNREHVRCKQRTEGPPRHHADWEESERPSVMTGIKSPRLTTEADEYPGPLDCRSPELKPTTNAINECQSGLTPGQKLIDPKDVISHSGKGCQGNKNRAKVERDLARRRMW